MSFTLILQVNGLSLRLHPAGLSKDDLQTSASLAFPGYVSPAFKFVVSVPMPCPLSVLHCFSFGVTSALSASVSPATCKSVGCVICILIECYQFHLQRVLDFSILLWTKISHPKIGFGGGYCLEDQLWTYILPLNMWIYFYFYF